jgi:hypothetical protein
MPVPQDEEITESKKRTIEAASDKEDASKARAQRHARRASQDDAPSLVDPVVPGLTTLASDENGSTSSGHEDSQASAASDSKARRRGQRLRGLQDEAFPSRVDHETVEAVVQSWIETVEEGDTEGDFELLRGSPQNADDLARVFANVPRRTLTSLSLPTLELLSFIAEVEFESDDEAVVTRGQLLRGLTKAGAFFFEDSSGGSSDEGDGSQVEGVIPKTFDVDSWEEIDWLGLCQAGCPKPLDESELAATAPRSPQELLRAFPFILKPSSKATLQDVPAERLRVLLLCCGGAVKTRSGRLVRKSEVIKRLRKNLWPPEPRGHGARMKSGGQNWREPSSAGSSNARSPSAAVGGQSAAVISSDYGDDGADPDLPTWADAHERAVERARRLAGVRAEPSDYHGPNQWPRRRPPSAQQPVERKNASEGDHRARGRSGHHQPPAPSARERRAWAREARQERAELHQDRLQGRTAGGEYYGGRDAWWLKEDFLSSSEEEETRFPPRRGRQPRGSSGNGRGARWEEPGFQPPYDVATRSFFDPRRGGPGQMQGQLSGPGSWSGPLLALILFFMGAVNGRLAQESRRSRGSGSLYHRVHRQSGNTEYQAPSFLARLARSSNALSLQGYVREHPVFRSPLEALQRTRREMLIIAVRLDFLMRSALPVDCCCKHRRPDRPCRAAADLRDLTGYDHPFVQGLADCLEVDVRRFLAITMQGENIVAGRGGRWDVAMVLESQATSVGSTLVDEESLREAQRAVKLRRELAETPSKKK